MKKQKQAITILLVGAFLILSLMVVSAQIPTAEAPTFWEKVTSFFKGGNTFTIVGQDTQADQYPYCKSGQTCYTSNGNNLGYWNVPRNTTFTKFTEQTKALCNGRSGLYNVYKIQGSSTVPWYEFIDYTSFICGNYNDYCRVELYCMPYVYPPTDSKCNSWKTGYEKVSNFDKDYDAELIDPIMPLYDMNTNKLAIEYFYCASSGSCSGGDISCWGKNSNGGCDKRTYDCTYTTYPNCPSTYPFTSESSCTGSLTTLDKTCSQNGGTWFYPTVQDCKGTIIPSKDTTKNCCSIQATDINNTQQLTCSQRNGYTCPIISDCPGNWLASSDSQRCCSQQCSATSTCASLGGLCILPSAAPSGSTDIGKKDCLNSNTCIKVQDSPINNTLSSAKKLSYSKDKIKSMTNNDLLAISCLQNSECFSLNSNETTSCISLKQLREEGIISQSQQDSFFNNAKSVLKTGAYSTIGSTVGCMLVYGSAALAFGPGAVVSVPVALGGCAIFGGLVGLTAGTVQTAYYDITDNDELVSKLKASDANSVGFCVAEESASYCKYTSWAAFFTIPGMNKCTSGLIIIFALIFLAILLIKR